MDSAIVFVFAASIIALGIVVYCAFVRPIQTDTVDKDPDA